jgi:tRNA dimethylallyltransferase
MPNPSPCLTIAGPTASGKSEVAIEVAKRINGEIIGADAFQIYRGLEILTAQVPEHERKGIPHHLVGCIDPTQVFDVASYLEMARTKIREVRASGRVPILVGGTGLYIRAVLQGLAEGLPPGDPELRAQLEREELACLVSRLADLDPEAMRTVDLKNPRRVVRALEVCLLTNKPFSSFRKQMPWEGTPAGIWIATDRQELNARITLRSEKMMQRGAINEVSMLNQRLGSTASQAIGIEGIRAFLEGRCSLAEVQQVLTLKTRQYAKRQQTWFKKDPSLTPCPRDSAIEAAVKLAATF